MKNTPFTIPDEIKIRAVKNIAEHFSSVFWHTPPLDDKGYLEKYREIFSFRKLHTGNVFEKAFYKRLQEMIQEEVEQILSSRH